MKALILKRYGRADQVAFADIPRPTIKPDEILVQVHAAGLNPIDTMIPKGTFKPILRLQLHVTMGSDLAALAPSRFSSQNISEPRWGRPPVRGMWSWFGASAPMR